MLTHLDIHREQREKQKIKNALYEKVLQQVYKKIQKTIKETDQKYVIYEPPFTIPFERYYSFLECLNFLVKNLKGKFSEVICINNRYLYIKWQISETKLGIKLKGDSLKGRFIL